MDECKPLVPGAEGVSADHQCIAWCNQLVRAAVEALVVRCRLTVSQPVLKPPMVGALETIIICKLLSTFAFSFNLRLYMMGTTFCIPLSTTRCQVGATTGVALLQVGTPR